MEIDSTVLLSALLTFVGFVAHILKKAGMEKISPVEYLAVHKGRTYTALSAVISAFVSLLILHPEASALEFFAVGYMADSLANRTPTREEIADFRLARQINRE